MKKIILSLCVIMAVLFGSSCMAASQVFVKGGMHLDWWEGDNDDVGLQYIMPFQVVGTSRDFSIELLGAYMYTEVNPDDAQRYSLSQMSDTKLNLSYGVYDTLPFDLLFGLGFNLPTGKTDLSREQMTLVQPPDLFTLPFFGEGLNVNPTIAVAKEWGTWVAGLGVGYTWRGEYDYSFDIQDYDPGDITTVTGEIRKAFTDDLTGRLYTQYLWYGKDTMDGDDFYQEGDAMLVGLGMSYKRPSWDLTSSVSAVFRDKNKLRQAGTFPTETNNSHGDELDASITHQYHMTKATALVSSLRFVHLEENDYPPASVFYAGKRDKITLGCGIEKSFANEVRASLGIDGFVMYDDKNWYHPGEDVTYTGLAFTALVSKGF